LFDKTEATGAEKMWKMDAYHGQVADLRRC